MRSLNADEIKSVSGGVQDVQCTGFFIYIITLGTIVCCNAGQGPVCV